MRLQPGDVIRVGNMDLVYVDETAADSRDELVFQPAPGRVETPRPNPRDNRPAVPPRVDSRAESRDEPRPPSDRGPKKPEAPAAKPVEQLSMFEGPVYTESQAIEAYQSEEDDRPRPLGRGESEPESSRKPVAAPPARTPLMSFGSRARPGEQDIIRSPLVLGLSLGGLALVLVTGIFWFLIGREQASRLYDRAVAELNEGQYAQSITSFEKFLKEYPNHALTRQAERGLDKALVQKQIAGATPAWKRGLDQLHELVTRHRNKSDFNELHPVIYKFAEEIAMGSARSAETTRDKELLTVSEDAQVMMERFADPSASTSTVLGRIKEARDAAMIAIGLQKLFDDGMSAVDGAIANRQPMVALAEREKLVRTFEGFRSHRRVKESLQKALDLERSVITADDTERAAEVNEAAFGGVSTLGLFQTRTRTEDSSQGSVAYALAKDCCYAIDAVTGELVWRRAVGFDPPFFPVTFTASQPGVLMYHAGRQSLLCCQPATGKLIWQQSLDARPRSAPLIHEGQIYLPTENRALCRIDAETGKLTERVTFSQNLSGPPVLSPDGNHLLIPGERAMIYALSMRPLAAAATTFTDHAPGSIAAPPMTLGKLLLLCDNDRADSSNLRMWDATNPRAPLVELTAKASRVRGQVRESPVLRGNHLVVPSTGEQVSAFTVSDDPTREGLAPMGQYRLREDEEKETKKDSDADAKQEVEGDQPIIGPIPARVPLYLALGPDRQFWAASSAFRRLEIGADAIHMDSKKTVAAGIASQRLQQIGELFYIGRKAGFHDAVVFSAVDRERMVIPWRIVLGMQLLEVTTARDGGMVAVSESGHMVQIGPDRLRQGGFDLKAAAELGLPSGVRERLLATRLHDGRLVLAANGDVPQLMIISTGGLTEQTTRLAKGETVQAAPVLLDDGLVVPLPGRLKLVGVGSGRKSIQDWLAPAGDKPASAWKFLVRLEGDELMACNASGLLTRIQVRTADAPHLAEAAKLQLPQPIDVAPVLKGDVLLVADAAGLVQQLNWRTFDLEGKRDFKTAVRGVWHEGSSWLVWTGDGKLHSLADGRDLPIRWSLELKDLEPAGAPVLDGDLLKIACRDGAVLTVDAMTGKESGRVKVPQALTSGLKRFDDHLFAIACDGTLYRLDP
jgi:outer membrane protein assembly factor BamB